MPPSQRGRWCARARTSLRLFPRSAPPRFSRRLPSDTTGRAKRGFIPRISLRRMRHGPSSAVCPASSSPSSTSREKFPSSRPGAWAARSRSFRSSRTNIPATSSTSPAAPPLFHPSKKNRPTRSRERSSMRSITSASSASSFSTRRTAGFSSTRSRRARTTRGTSRSTPASRASSSSSCAPSPACRSARRSCCAPPRWRTCSAISGPAALRGGRRPAPCRPSPLHVYGKKDPRPGRKMGHLTALAATPEAARARVLDARASLLR